MSAIRTVAIGWALLLTAAAGCGEKKSGGSPLTAAGSDAGAGGAGVNAGAAGTSAALPLPAAGAGDAGSSAAGSSAVSADAGAAGAAGAADAAAAGGGGSTGASPAAGSGGGTAALVDAGTDATAPDAASTPALGPDCNRDPLANVQPFERGFYREFVGLFGCTAPADLALYREMLPAKFEMPANPEVCFYINDFKISSVGPYHEAAILLPIEYGGEMGKYVLSMALDNQAATSGGRAVGFPKYIGEVSLEQTGTNWIGLARNQGEVDLQATYTGECLAEDVFPWPDFINLTPIPSGTPSNQAFLSPRMGSAVMVPAEYLVEPSYYSLKGRVTLEIADDLPWNGLIDESQPFAGHLVSFKGGIDLGNRRLD